MYRTLVAQFCTAKKYKLVNKWKAKNVEENRTPGSFDDCSKIMADRILLIWMELILIKYFLLEK